MRISHTPSRFSNFLCVSISFVQSVRSTTFEFPSRQTMNLLDSLLSLAPRFLLRLSTLKNTVLLRSELTGPSYTYIYVYSTCSVKPSIMFYCFIFFFLFVYFSAHSLVPRSLASFFSPIHTLSSWSSWFARGKKKILCFKRPNVLCASYKQSRRKSILNVYYLLLSPPVVFSLVRLRRSNGCSVSYSPLSSCFQAIAWHIQRNTHKTRRGADSNRTNRDASFGKTHDSSTSEPSCACRVVAHTQ